MCQTVRTEEEAQRDYLRALSSGIGVDASLQATGAIWASLLAWREWEDFRHREQMVLDEVSVEKLIAELIPEDIEAALESGAMSLRGAAGECGISLTEMRRRTLAQGIQVATRRRKRRKRKAVQKAQAARKANNADTEEG